MGPWRTARHWYAGDVGRQLGARDRAIFNTASNTIRGALPARGAGRND